MQNYQHYIQRKRQKYGDRFDGSELARQFISYFENGQRIKVDFGDDMILTGTVGVTTGWRPVFLLIRTSRSTGSPYMLSATDKIVEVTKYQSRH